MKNSRIVNKNRSKLFGIVINPKLSGTVDWKSMSVSEIGEKLKQLKFLDKYSLMNYLNNLEVKNVSNNTTLINDYVGQLELGTESRIPHYQLAVEMETICTKKRVLESLEEKINAHISVQVQFNFEDMKKYCEKKTEFILPEYSGKICKHEWDMDLLDRRPELRRFMETPFAWQTFLENSINEEVIRLEQAEVKKLTNSLTDFRNQFENKGLSTKEFEEESVRFIMDKYKRFFFKSKLAQRIYKMNNFIASTSLRAWAYRATGVLGTTN